MPEVPVSQKVLRTPCTTTIVPTALRKIAVLLSATGGPDLDANCILFDSKGKGLEVLSFARPMSKDGRITHKDRRNTNYPYNQAFNIDLTRIDSRIFAMTFVVSSFHDNLSGVTMPRTRLVQQYMKGVETIEKDVIVYAVPNLGGPNRKTASKSSCLVVANLYKDTAKGTWTFRSEFTFGNKAFNDVMIGLARSCLHAGLPAFSLPEERLKISRINDIATYITPSTLDTLRRLFPVGGFPIDDFVSVMTEVLLEDMPELNNIDQVSRLVGLLRDLFCQIDVHADGMLMWNEFTDYCVEAGLQVLATVQCASDREYEYRVARVSRLADNIRCSRLLYKELSVQCKGRVICVPQLSSMVNFLAMSSLQMTEQICAERYEFTSKYAKTQMTNVDTLVVVHHVEWVPDLCQIFVASSNTAVSRWEVKKGNVYKWITNMYPGDNVIEAVPMASLLWVPSYGRRGELVSVGTDHRLYIWDIDKGHIVHTFERAQREHVSCLVPFSGISRTVATSSFDHTVVVWDVENREKKSRLEIPYPPKKISYSDERLLTVGPKDSTVWDVTSMTAICSLSVVGESENDDDNVLVGGSLLTFHDSGEGRQTRAIIGDHQNNFTVWNVTIAETSADQRPKVLQTFKITDGGFGHLRDFVLVSDTKSVWPDVYAMGSGRELVVVEAFKLTNSSLPSAITLYNPVVDSVAGISGNGFKVWDMQTSEEMLSHDNAAAAEITAAVFDEPLFRKIYLGCRNGHLIVQNYLSGKPLAPSIPLHKAAITMIRYYFPARQFVTAAADKTLKISKDDINGKISVIRSIENAHPEGSIASMCISHMVGFIASATASSSIIRIWDYETLSFERELREGHEGDIIALENMTGYPAFVAADSHHGIYIWMTKKEGRKRLQGFRVAAILVPVELPGDSSAFTCIVTHSDSQIRPPMAQESIKEIQNNADLAIDNEEIKKASEEARITFQEIEASIQSEGLESAGKDLNGPLTDCNFVETNNEIDEEDEAMEDMPGLIVQIAAFDTAGMVYTWDAMAIMVKLKCNPVREVQSRNPSFRISRNASGEKPSSTYQKKVDSSVVKCFDSNLGWQAHSEPIISGCFLDETLVVTSSMDLSLRLFANAACIVNADHYPPKSKLGEINLLDGDEERINRKDHWVRPSMDAHLKHKVSCRHIALDLMSNLEEKAAIATMASSDNDDNNSLESHDPTLFSRASFLTEAPSIAESAASNRMAQSVSLPSIFSNGDMSAATNATALRCLEAQKTRTPRKKPKGSEIGKDLPKAEARKLRRKLAQLEAVIGQKEDDEGSWRCTANTKSLEGSVIYTKLFKELGRNKYIPILQSKINTAPSKFVQSKLPEVAAKVARREERRRRREMEQERTSQEKEEARRNSKLGDCNSSRENIPDDDSTFPMSEMSMSSSSTAFRRRGDGLNGGHLDSSWRHDTTLQPHDDEREGEEFGMDEIEMARLRARWAETQEKFKNIVLATEEDEAIFVQKGKEKLKITTKGQERARTPSRKALMSQGSDEPFSPSNDKDPKNFGAISEEQIIELARLIRTIDVDGDGKININEFQSLKRSASDHFLKSLTFEFIDRDHSGFITVSEFVQLTYPLATPQQWSRMTRFIKKYNIKTETRPSSRVATREEAIEAKEIFAAVDVDRSGTVTASELFEYMEKADQLIDGRPLALTKEDISRFIEAHDNDHNQMLDEGEFVNFFVNII